ncbi:NADAR family protein [Pseudomonas syringae pv. actinidiae]|nr:NADAR family protein [Pseudomonas syringae pv. actinidiae]
MKVEKGLTMFYTGDDVLSNWYMRDFKIKDITFNCGEQAMMFSKARLFGDDKIAQEILKAKYPRDHKRLGKKVGGFVQKVWDEKCVPIVRAVNLHRCSQHKDIKEVLLAARGTTIVEASGSDRIWGVGFTEDDPRIHQRELWGQNLLGYAHMDNCERLFQLEMRRQQEKSSQLGMG